MASFTVQAQTALGSVAAEPSLPAALPAPAVVAAPSADIVVIDVAAGTPPAPVGSSMRSKATEAAAATLTALLPRLAANDMMPLLDSSTLLAGDLSRLLASYRLDQNGALAKQDSSAPIQALLQRALTLLGTPYRWGGTSPDSGFDCSGLVGYVFRTALGIELPRVSRDMASKADAELIKDRGDLQQGDLVFFGRRGRVD
ncbi:MAG: C40 family peptidase, partial [Pseudoxanthomonas sp.]|nr:C40 family peptidase [Pseudoxanthomonas sp.]